MAKVTVDKPDYFNKLNLSEANPKICESGKIPLDLFYQVTISEHLVNGKKLKLVFKIF